MNPLHSLNPENPRKSEHAIDPIFLNRWSPRSFLSEKPVNDADLFAIFEAARWAPSSNNEQSWRFIVARTPEERAKFLPFINEFNRIWCEKAPVLTLVLSKTVTSRGTPYYHHAFDAGTAWGFLALQAVQKGLITHPIGGFDANLARTVLNIPEEYVPQLVVAIGYQGDASQLEENHRLRETPNTRRPLNETLMFGEFTGA